MSRKRWFIWLAVAVVVLGAAVAGAEVVAQRRRLAKMQSRWLQSAQFLRPPHFILTLLQEGKIKSDEQYDELWKLSGRTVTMLTEWRHRGSAHEIVGDYEIDIEDPSTPMFIVRDDAAPSNDAMYTVLEELVRVAHEWDGVGDLPDFYGIAESRMYEYDNYFSIKRSSGKSYRNLH